MTPIFSKSLLVSALVGLTACGSGSGGSETPKEVVNKPPVITPVANISAFEKDRISITMPVRDEDSLTLTYSWRQTAGTSVTIDNSSALNASF